MEKVLERRGFMVHGDFPLQVVPALPVTRVMRPVKRHAAWSAGCPLFAGKWRGCLAKASCLFGISTRARGGPACTAISRKAAEGASVPHVSSLAEASVSVVASGA